MNQPKELLRAWAKQKRLTMAKADALAKSVLIQDKIIAQINWQVLKSLHCYQAIESLNEVRTDKIIEFLQTKQPQIKLTLAKKNQEEADSKETYDLVLIPTLAFDKRAYRLGWGGGYYDKFLASQPQALKIGLCFQSGFVPAGLPAEPHDIPLDKVVTESD